MATRGSCLRTHRISGRECLPIADVSFLPELWERMRTSPPFLCRLRRQHRPDGVRGSAWESDASRRRALLHADVWLQRRPSGEQTTASTVPQYRPVHRPMAAARSWTSGRPRPESQIRRLPRAWRMRGRRLRRRLRERPRPRPRSWRPQLRRHPRLQQLCRRQAPYGREQLRLGHAGRGWRSRHEWQRRRRRRWPRPERRAPCSDRRHAGPPGAPYGAQGYGEARNGRPAGLAT